MENELMPFGVQDSGPFHGTKADLKAGDLLEPGYSSNYGERRNANFVSAVRVEQPGIHIQRL